MVRAVIERGCKTYHRIACRESLCNAVTKPFFDCREVVFRNGSADYRGFEYEIVAVARLEFYPNIAELAVTARLLLVLALCLYRLSDSLAVCDLRELKRYVYAEVVFKL